MDMMMGDNAKPTGKPITFRIQLMGKTVAGGDYTVKVIKNGDPYKTLKAEGAMPVAEFTDTPAAIGRTYYRIEVTGPPTDYPEVPGSMALSGNMVGLSNPIYFNFDPNF